VISGIWRIAALAAGLLFTTILVEPTHCQEITAIPDEIVCAECRIDVELMFELGGPGDTTNIVHANFLPMDSRGRVYYQSVYFPGSIVVFDAEGRHIKTFGREGEGPGELAAVAALFISPGDSLYAIDSGLYRLNVFSPEFEFVRSARIDPPLRPGDGFFRKDGSLVVTAVARGPETAGHPFHILGPDGRVRRSFGEYEGMAAGDDEPNLNRRIDPAEDGGFWAAQVYDQYRVEHWGPEGELLEILERHPDWAPSPDDPSRGPQDASGPPPSSVVANIQVDDAGRLWMLVWVADEDWKTAFDNPDGQASRHDLRDTVIEVLDPAQKRVVARTRIDDLALGFSAPGVMYTWDEREVFDKLKLWRLHLVEPSVLEAAGAGIERKR
jgi:hypothetical protein